jgi:WD40 repeat protein
MPISSNGIHSAALGTDYLYVGGGDGKLKKINLAAGQWTLSHEALLDSKIMSINLSNDEKELIVGTISGKMYRVLTNDLSFMLHSDAHSACINDISFGQDSNLFAAIDESGALKIWDLSEYKSVVTLLPSKVTGGVSCFIAKDDQTVMTGWRDGFLRCFDIQKRAQLWEINNAHRGAITSIYADENYILTGGQDGAVRVWARQNRKLLAQFNGKYSCLSNPLVAL